MNKAFHVLLITLIVAFLTGCSKKGSDPNTSYSALIVGQWDYTADTTKAYTNGALIRVNPGGGIVAGDYQQFNADGSGTSFISNATTSFSYKISGSQITINFPQQIVNGSTYPAFTEVGTIKMLTSSSLSIFIDTKTTGNGVNYENTEAAYFKKD